MSTVINEDPQSMSAQSNGETQSMSAIINKIPQSMLHLQMEIRKV